MCVRNIVLKMNCDCLQVVEFVGHNKKIMKIYAFESP